MTAATTVRVCPRGDHESHDAPLGAVCPVHGLALVNPAVREAWPDDPLLGQRIGGRYLVVGVIGRGGMGTVYEALQEPVGRLVALKVLRSDGSADMRHRFFQEAQIIGRLRHPAAVTLYDSGESEDGSLFMALERLDGRTLRDALAAEGPMAPRRVVHIATQILGALAEAHGLGLVHRDLKPWNVMLVQGPLGEEQAKILDFGIAKVLHGEVDGLGPVGDTHVRTRRGLVLGTPHYMSPEQAAGRVVGPASDLYSVGVVMYKMLVGRTPFSGHDAIEVLVAHRRAAVPPLPSWTGAPPRLRAVIERALSKEPEARFPSARAMAEALRASVPLALAERMGRRAPGGGTRWPSEPPPPAPPPEPEGEGPRPVIPRFHARPLTSIVPVEDHGLEAALAADEPAAVGPEACVDDSEVSISFAFEVHEDSVAGRHVTARPMGPTEHSISLALDLMQRPEAAAALVAPDDAVEPPGFVPEGVAAAEALPVDPFTVEAGPPPRVDDEAGVDVEGLDDDDPALDVAPAVIVDELDAADLEEELPPAPPPTWRAMLADASEAVPLLTDGPAVPVDDSMIEAVVERPLRRGFLPAESTPHLMGEVARPEIVSEREVSWPLRGVVIAAAAAALTLGILSFSPRSGRVGEPRSTRVLTFTSAGPEPRIVTETLPEAPAPPSEMTLPVTVVTPDAGPPVVAAPAAPTAPAGLHMEEF